MIRASATGWLLAIGLAAQADVETLVRRLGNERDHDDRNAAYRQLQRSKPTAALPLLVKALPGWHPTCQNQGVSLLLSYPRVDSDRALRRLIDTGSPFLTVACGVTLYQRGDKEFAGAIAKALSAEVETNVRQRMLGRLSNVSTPAIVDAVRKLIHAFVHPGVLQSALDYLKRVGDRTAMPAIDELANDEKFERPERARCAAFLISAGRVEHEATLVEQIDEAGDDIDFYGVERLLSGSGRLGEQLIIAVGKFAENATSEHRAVAATRLLARHGKRRAVPVLRRLLDDAPARVAKAALEQLATIDGGLERKQLAKLLDSELPELRLAAAHSLRRLDDDSGLRVVLAMLESGAGDRADAVRILGGFRVPAAVPALLAALEDDELDVRRSAESGLRNVLQALYPYRRFDLATTGYRPDAPAARRQAGAAAIRAWWEAHR